MVSDITTTVNGVDVTGDERVSDGKKYKNKEEERKTENITRTTSLKELER